MIFERPIEVLEKALWNASEGRLRDFTMPSKDLEKELLEALDSFEAFDGVGEEVWALVGVWQPAIFYI